jgi:hypothetical protein
VRDCYARTELEVQTCLSIGDNDSDKQFAELAIPCPLDEHRIYDLVAKDTS